MGWGVLSDLRFSRLIGLMKTVCGPPELWIQDRGRAGGNSQNYRLELVQSLR
jgi:hypothetical protein